MTYNHAPYIRQCLDGFMMQQCDFGFEVLIHDDASTDGTQKIIREYETKYPDIIKPLLQTENQFSRGSRGIMMRRFNFPRARGKYIALCEGDDYWTDPRKLQKQVDFLETHEDVSLCFHNALMVYEDGGSLRQPFQNLGNREYSGAEILRHWTIPTASVVFRRENYVMHHSPNYFFGDIILFLTLAEKGKLWCLDETMSAYRRHRGGLSYMERNAFLSCDPKILKHYEEIGKNFGGKYKGVACELINDLYLKMAIEQFRHMNFRFIRSLFLCFRDDPRLCLKNIKSRFI